MSNSLHLAGGCSAEELDVITKEDRMSENEDQEMLSTSASLLNEEGA